MRRVLIEIGCLGRVVEVDSCRQSSSRRSQLPDQERRAVRPVYPVGTDPAAARDYRDYL